MEEYGKKMSKESGKIVIELTGNKQKRCLCASLLFSARAMVAP
jgi:hypothetical protein